MKKKNILLLVPLVLTLLSSSLVACTDKKETFKPDLIYSDSENGGSQDDADKDVYDTQSIEDLKTLFNNLVKFENYRYELTLSTSGGTAEEYVHYYTPYAWYQKNLTVPSESIGYAQDKEQKLFKYRFNANNEVQPSLYYYSATSSGDPKPWVGLYDSFSFANLAMLKSYLTSEDYASKTAPNKFVITNDNITSIFQYMTGYGTSISGSISKVEIEILNLETSEFKCTITLGNKGSFVGHFIAEEDETLKNVEAIDKKCQDGSLKGVEKYDEIVTFSDKANENNYVLDGFYQRFKNTNTGKYEDPSTPTNIYKINCTNNYFYLDYDLSKIEGGESEENQKKYVNFGSMMFPENTEVTYLENGTSKTVKYAYDSAFGFVNGESKDSYVFDTFIGPISNGDHDYIKVDKLPEKGEEGNYYIVPKKDGKGSDIYQWQVIDADGNYGWELTSQKWYECVGDFYFQNGTTATFYLSSQVVSILAPYFYEQDMDNKDLYYCTDSTVNSLLAGGLFGWGYQATNTWTENMSDSFIKINRDSANNILNYEIGIHFSGNYYGSPKQAEVSYKISDFGKGNIASLDALYNSMVNKGGKNI